MALQVWLPLNGNIENHGVSNAYVVNNGATVSNSGKIGKCYSFTESQYLSLNNVPFSILTNCSVCFWMYLDSNQDWLPCTGGSNGSNTGQYFLATGSNSGAFYHSGVGSNVITIYCDGKKVTDPSTAGAWHHYCITGLDLSTWTGMAINHYGDYGSWNFDGKLNDFRIYDHCLSPKEVKEISKGLVLHYKMDDGCLKTANNLVTKLTGGEQCTISNNTVTISGSNSDTYFYLNTSAALTSGKTYKISCVGHFDDGKYYYFPIGGQSNTSPGQLLVKNGYCSLVFTANSIIQNCGTQIIMDDTTRSSGAGTITNITLEEVNGIYDCSGFGYNGIAYGNLTMSSDTSRYNLSTVFNGNDSAINIGDLNTVVPEGVFTFNCWFKKADWGSKGYETIFGGPSGFELECKNGGTNSPIIWAYSWGQGTKEYSLNEWNMLTMVRTLSDTKFYLNGEIAITGNAGTIPPGNYFIGAWNNSDLQNYKGSVSDVRLYSTPLSAEDVKELYNTSAVVCDNGTVMAYSLEE